MNVHELSSKHLTDYVQDGFTLVSGLMGDSIATAAELAMWSCMKARPDDPDTWPDSFAEGVDHPDIIACYTDAFLQVAAQLGGESSARFEAPGGALAIGRGAAFHLAPYGGTERCSRPLAPAPFRSYRRT